MKKIDILKEAKYFLKIKNELRSNLVRVGISSAKQIQKILESKRPNDITALIAFLNYFCLGSFKRFGLLEYKLNETGDKELINTLIKAGLRKQLVKPQKTPMEKTFIMALGDIKKITDEIAKIYPGMFE